MNSYNVWGHYETPVEGTEEQVSAVSSGTKRSITVCSGGMETLHGLWFPSFFSALLTSFHGGSAVKNLHRWFVLWLGILVFKHVRKSSLWCSFYTGRNPLQWCDKCQVCVNHLKSGSYCVRCQSIRASGGQTLPLGFSEIYPYNGVHTSASIFNPPHYIGSSEFPRLSVQHLILDFLFRRSEKLHSEPGMGCTLHSVLTRGHHLGRGITYEVRWFLMWWVS